MIASRTSDFGCRALVICKTLLLHIARDCPSAHVSAGGRIVVPQRMDTIHEQRPDHEKQLFLMEQAGYSRYSKRV